MGRMFNPDGTVRDRDALRSLQFNGQGMRVPRSKVVGGNKVVEIIDQDDGRTAGWHTHHKSGRLDANVTPLPAKAGVRNGNR
jgi:hypothetical protein